MSAIDDVIFLDTHSQEMAIDLTVVVPLMNEDATLSSLYERVRDVCEHSNLTFEIVFVDDGSTDGSAAVMQELAEQDDRVRPLHLRRNFGKAAALATGFRNSRGRFVATMDADLQDDPEEIPKMLAILRSGTDVVSGWKKERHDPLSRRLASRLFNAATRRMTGIPLHDFNCGIKAYRGETAREIADGVIGEMHRYLPVLASARGYRVAEMVVRHHPRTSGRSRYGLERYARGLLDLVTVTYLTRYGRRPMHALGGFGLWLAGTGITVLAIGVAVALLGLTPGGIVLPLAGVALVALAVQCGLVGLVAEVLVRHEGSPVPTVELSGPSATRADAASLRPTACAEGEGS
jgi:glycosyltransferase involved in cell wall biosynthesis